MLVGPAHTPLWVGGHGIGGASAGAGVSAAVSVPFPTRLQDCRADIPNGSTDRLL